MSSRVPQLAVGFLLLRLMLLQTIPEALAQVTLPKPNPKTTSSEEAAVFDRISNRVHFQNDGTEVSETEAVVRILVAANQSRTRLTDTAARAKSLAGLHGFERRLDAANVRQVYLIYGKTEYRVSILEQTNTALRFRVPSDVPVGPMRLAAMLTGRAELMEQPVELMVLEGNMTERRHTPAR